MGEFYIINKFNQTFCIHKSMFYNCMLGVKHVCFIMPHKNLFHFYFFFLQARKHCSICCQLAVNLTFNLRVNLGDQDV